MTDHLPTASSSSSSPVDVTLGPTYETEQNVKFIVKEKVGKGLGSAIVTSVVLSFKTPQHWDMNVNSPSKRHTKSKENSSQSPTKPILSSSHISQNFLCYKFPMLKLFKFKIKQDQKQ